MVRVLVSILKYQIFKVIQVQSFYEYLCTFYRNIKLMIMFSIRKASIQNEIGYDISPNTTLKNVINFSYV